MAYDILRVREEVRSERRDVERQRDERDGVGPEEPARPLVAEDSLEIAPELKWKLPPVGVAVVHNPGEGGAWIEKWRGATGQWVHNYTRASMARHADAKFAENRRFGGQLVAIRAQVNGDLHRGDRRAVTALAVALIDRTYFRVGNEASDAGGVFGVSTLHARHVDIEGVQVTFDFIGKKKVEQRKVITDPELAPLLAALKMQARSPSARLFAFAGRAIDAAQINAYLAPFNATAKQFRTYHATRLARDFLLAHPASTKHDRRVTEKAMFVAVAHELGHTPAVCRQSYIDPRVLVAYEAGELR